MQRVRAHLRSLAPCVWGTLFLATASAAQSFRQPILVPTGNQPVAVYAADINGDGNPDLIVVDAGAVPNGASTTRVLLGDGKGGFTQSAVLSTVGNSVGIGDFSGDGILDLAWLSSVTEAADYLTTIHIARGVGNGTYLPETQQTETYTYTSSMAAAGGPQLWQFLTAVQATAGGPADLIAEEGLHGFCEDFGFGTRPLVFKCDSFDRISVGPITVADLTRDRLPDLLLSGTVSQSVDVVVDRGTQRYFPGITSHHSDQVRSLLVHDMDGDGVPDLITEDPTGAIQIFHGFGDGTFARSSEIGAGANDMSTGRGGRLIAVSDLNGDGFPDLMTATPLGLSVLLGGANLSFTLKGIYTIGPGRETFATADFNRDGHLDFAVNAPTGVHVILSNADGSLGAPAAVVGSLSILPEPSVYGSSFTLSANVTPTGSATPAPTGTVTFSIDGNALGTATVSNGATQYSVSNLASEAYIPGAHTVSAVYSGDANYSTATLTATHAVQRLPTVTAISNLVTPIYYGQEIGYTNGIDAVVSVNPANSGAQPAGATLAGGLIYIYLDGQLVCSLVQGGSGPTGGPQRCNDANFMGFGAGNHTMVAAYQGNSYYDGSTSITYTVVILPDDTVTQATTSLTPAPYGSGVQLTATVTAPYATPTGTVQFLDGSTVIGTGMLAATGGAFASTATIPVSNLAVGTRSIVANYIPTPIPAQNPPRNFNPSQASLTQAVLATSATLLTSSLNPSTLGDSVMFTAAITLGGLPGPAAGTVLFTDNGLTLGLVPLNAQGVANYTTSTLALGQHPIVATFSPSSASVFSSNASLTQVVLAPVYDDYTLTATPSNLAVGVGNSGTIVVTVTPTGKFNEPVALSCSGLPFESTCTFLATTIPAGGGSTQLAIHPEAPHNCGDTAQYFIAGNNGWLALGIGSAAALLFGPRRRRLRAALFGLLLCLLPLLGGCGLGGHCTDLGTRPGTYSFTLVGRSTGAAAITHSVTIRMNAFLDGEPH